MVIVHKRDGSVRLCIDTRQLNEALRLSYPLPTLEEVLQELSKAKVFSKVSLRSGYWHVMLEEAASDLIAFQLHAVDFDWQVVCLERSFPTEGSWSFSGLEGHSIADDIIAGDDGDNMEEAIRSHEEGFMKFLQGCVERGIVLIQGKFGTLCTLHGIHESFLRLRWNTSWSSKGRGDTECDCPSWCWTGSVIDGVDLLSR